MKCSGLKALAYLAAPYSGMEEFSFRMSCAVAARLLDDGELIFSPIVHSHPLEAYLIDHKNDHDFWIEFDTHLMERCQVLYVLAIDGWEKSKGVQFEIEWFESNKLPIFLLVLDYDTGGVSKRRYYRKNGVLPALMTEQIKLFGPIDK